MKISSRAARIPLATPSMYDCPLTNLGEDQRTAGEERSNRPLGELFLSWRSERVERMSMKEWRLVFQLSEEIEPLISFFFLLEFDDHQALKILHANSVVRSRLAETLIESEGAINQHRKADVRRSRSDVDQIRIFQNEPFLSVMEFKSIANERSTNKDRTTAEIIVRTLGNRPFLHTQTQTVDKRQRTHFQEFPLNRQTHIDRPIVFTDHRRMFAELRMFQQVIQVRLKTLTSFFDGEMMNRGQTIVLGGETRFVFIASTGFIQTAHGFAYFPFHEVTQRFV